MTPEKPDKTNIGEQVAYAPYPGEPMHSVYPAMDARFILTELGRLTSKVDRLIEDVSKLNPKVDTLRGQVAFVKGAAWIIGILVVFVGPLVGLLVSGRLMVSLR